MKKRLKVVSMIGLFCFMFAAGYLGCRISGFVGKKNEILLFMEMNNVRNIIPSGDLDEEDAEFIWEHVLGQWKISERAIDIKHDENISRQGIKEMKDLVFVYDKDYVMIKGYDQNTFSKRDDIFFYIRYGGNREVNLPVYHVDRHVDEDYLMLGYLAQGQHSRFPEACELVHVRYDLGYGASQPSVLADTTFAASDIYVNPDDKDTLYIDMYGLWKLERVVEE